MYSVHLFTNTNSDTVSVFLYSVLRKKDAGLATVFNAFWCLVYYLVNIKIILEENLTTQVAVRYLAHSMTHF